MMTEFEFENEVARIVDPKGELSLNDILKLVEEKFTSTNSANLPCEHWGTEIHNGKEINVCYHDDCPKWARQA